VSRKHRPSHPSHISKQLTRFKRYVQRFHVQFQPMPQADLEQSPVHNDNETKDESNSLIEGGAGGEKGKRRGASSQIQRSVSGLVGLKRG
jgi:hypothetical protein